jgi:hypothetical protein
MGEVLRAAIFESDLTATSVKPQQLVSELPAFDAFWTLYPKHVGKLDTRRAWARINPALHNDILLACVNWRPIWLRIDPDFLPYPATWLNGERWEDELPRGIAVPAVAAHKPAILPADVPRETMPDRVRDALAAIRGRR